MTALSIIVPTLDEAEGIARALAPLQAMRARGVEVVVVDGGSRDATKARAAALCDRVLDAPRGRASQMNAGARASRGDILVFVHADTVLPDRAPELVVQALTAPGCAWGRFDVRIAGGGALLGLVGAAMNLRSRLTGIATGDQALFVRRTAFEAVGGYPAIALMEDVALSTALKRRARPACLRERVVTSGRRWQRGGVLRTVALMGCLRLAYALGADPQLLARRYDAERTSS